GACRGLWRRVSRGARGPLIHSRAFPGESSRERDWPQRARRAQSRDERAKRSGPGRPGVWRAERLAGRFSLRTLRRSRDVIKPALKRKVTDERPADRDAEAGDGRRGEGGGPRDGPLRRDADRREEVRQLA